MCCGVSALPGNAAHTKQQAREMIFPGPGTVARQGQRTSNSLLVSV